MTICGSAERWLDQHRILTAGIFDVDGVLLATPHERAWREALPGIADPARFTTAMYQLHVAGKPRLSGARAALEALGVPDAGQKAVVYAERKQKRLEELIEAGNVTAFPDAIRFVQAVQALGWPMAVASSSQNATKMMQSIRLESDQSLLDIFSANVCGRHLQQGKPIQRFSCWLPRSSGSNPHGALSSRMPLPASRQRALAAWPRLVSPELATRHYCGQHGRIWW